MPEHDLLTVSEAAKALRVHANTVRAWITAGHLRAITLPGGRGLHRIRRADLESLLASAA
jgi:excisionase family DNA binding protein